MGKIIIETDIIMGKAYKDSKSIIEGEVIGIVKYYDDSVKVGLWYINQNGEDVIHWIDEKNCIEL